MTKITRATIKSFINKNFDNLYIKHESHFDGMTDCVERIEDDFDKVLPDENVDYRLGVKGAFFVGGSRNYFKEYETEEFKGFEVYNCCGSFILAIKK